MELLDSFKVGDRIAVYYKDTLENTGIVKLLHEKGASLWVQENEPYHTYIGDCFKGELEEVKEIEYEQLELI